MALASVQLYSTLSPLTSGKVFPGVAPYKGDPQGNKQDTDTPYISYQRISTQPENTLDGFSGHEWVNMQIDVYHGTDYEAELLANNVLYILKTNIPGLIYDGRTQGQDFETGYYYESLEIGMWQTAPTNG